MVWRDPNNPLGLPGGLAGQVTAVLIHSQTILTAGHFAARAERGASAMGSGRRQLRSECTRRSPRGSTSIAPSARALLIRRFRGPALPQSCPFDDIDGQYEPGSATWVCAFSTSPCSAFDLPSWPTAASTTSVSPGTRMTIVGYGTTAPAPGGPADTSLYDGIRRWGRSTVDQVIDQNWVTFNRDPVAVCYGDSGAPTFFNGRVVAIASDGAARLRVCRQSAPA